MLKKARIQFLGCTESFNKVWGVWHTYRTSSQLAGYGRQSPSVGHTWRKDSCWQPSKKVAVRADVGDV